MAGQLGLDESRPLQGSTHSGERLQASHLSPKAHPGIGINKARARSGQAPMAPLFFSRRCQDSHALCNAFGTSQLGTYPISRALPGSSSVMKLLGLSVRNSHPHSLKLKSNPKPRTRSLAWIFFSIIQKTVILINPSTLIFLSHSR